jgi:hypothetical protein
VFSSKTITPSSAFRWTGRFTVGGVSPAVMPQDPINVQRLIHQNDFFAAAAAHAKQLHASTVIANWHERAAAASAVPGGTVLPGMSSMHASTSARARPLCQRAGRAMLEEMQQEQEAARRSVLCMRRARLRELLQRDAAAMEQELAARGLGLKASAGWAV